MADNNAHHPGVRSLLAKFETNQTPSPSDRGRSPLSCDTSAVRQLSRVRASFVTVEGAIQSATPGSPLRKTSGRSEPDIFGPKINEQEVSHRHSVVSPTPAAKVETPHNGISDRVVLDQVVKDSRPEPAQCGAKEEPASPVENAASSKETTASRKTPIPNTSTKRPPTLHSPKNNASSKSSTMSASATTHPTTARETAKERANASTHTTNRASTHPTKPTTTRATRASVPSQKPAPQSLTSPKAPTKHVRLPASMTAPTRSSVAKTGTTAPTTRASANTSTKQSSVKSASGVPTRSAAGATNVRKQPRPSLPAHDNVATKPVNNSFLTRMMRPTASSANKTHDKTDNVPPPKTTTTRALRAPIGKATERVNVQPKAKAAPLRLQTEKSQVLPKDLAQKDDATKIAHKRESAKENTQESIPETPVEPETEKPNETIVEPVFETPVKLTEEVKDEPVNIESEPTAERTAEPKSPAQPAAADLTPAPKEVLTEVLPLTEEAPIRDDSNESELLTNATHEVPGESTVVSGGDETKLSEVSIEPTDAQTPSEVKDVTLIDDVLQVPEEPTFEDESSSVDTPETLENPDATKFVQEIALPENTVSPYTETSTIAEQSSTEKSTVDEIDIVGLTLN
ncbi:hypothetical protein N7495_008353 [Penicillium taxi]|uniref:uncharacterized protein n=1 Tax=Penicillium taxi TaxID=168475 RepID=UPI002544DBA2|nr:uncharacterized protein N7495_008353 [Penicillium taxi]KAJ5888312.1 hypothetical protein N7495_008353 [Penicillium taxi]